MIERVKVNNQDATVAYLTKDFQPCEKHEADFCEVHFDGDRSRISDNVPQHEESGCAGVSRLVRRTPPELLFGPWVPER
jgi:hypothetical protein